MKFDSIKGPIVVDRYSSVTHRHKLTHINRNRFPEDRSIVPSLTTLPAPISSCCPPTEHKRIRGPLETGTGNSNKFRLEETTLNRSWLLVYGEYRPNFGSSVFLNVRPFLMTCHEFWVRVMPRRASFTKRFKYRPAGLFFEPKMVHPWSAFRPSSCPALFSSQLQFFMEKSPWTTCQQKFWRRIPTWLL